MGQWATPHHLSDVRRGAPSCIWDYLAHSDITIYVIECYTCYTLHDRRLGGIGRVVPIARCSRCSDWFVIAERLLQLSVRTIFQRRRFGLVISFHQIHPRHDRRLGGIGRVVPIASRIAKSSSVAKLPGAMDYHIKSPFICTLIRIVRIDIHRKMQFNDSFIGIYYSYVGLEPSVRISYHIHR